MEGNGMIQVDFKNYFNWDNKLIFLEKGQYIKFLSDSFTVREIIFDNKESFDNPDVRVLFKHLVAVGYINFEECLDCQKYLEDTLYSNNNSIIDISVNQWYWQNPFNANQSEYQIIFDLKEVIDQEFKNILTTDDVFSILGQSGRKMHRLIKNKVGLSIKDLISRKKVLESQKLIAFTDQNIETIGYELGYTDPAYFNRMFKNKTGITPGAFRDQIGYQHEDHFEQQLFELLKEFHSTQRQTGFYASKLYMSEKTLSRKVKDKFNISIGKLIRYEIIKTAKMNLIQGMKIKEVAFMLGFNEVSHFTSFFKKYTNQTPSQFLSKKYKQ
jgi:AraC-like DNA-binding protein